jgi:hypothetical protein
MNLVLIVFFEGPSRLSRMQRGAACYRIAANAAAVAAAAAGRSKLPGACIYQALFPQTDAGATHHPLSVTSILMKVRASVKKFCDAVSTALSAPHKHLNNHEIFF